MIAQFSPQNGGILLKRQHTQPLYKKIFSTKEQHEKTTLNDFSAL